MVASPKEIKSPAVKFVSEDESLLYRESMAATSVPAATVDAPIRDLTTPNDSNTSVFVLTPSRTITETLTSLANQTGSQLEEVWDEVGYSPEDRASQLSDLLSKIQTLCEQKIAEETGVAETFRQTIKESKEEIVATSNALKIEVDPDEFAGDSKLSLSDELTVLESRLEGLRVAAKVARDDLKECSEYLVEAHEALGIELAPKWLDIESDLTAQHREEFHKKRDETLMEMSSRTSAVIRLVRDCQHLLHELKIEPTAQLDRQILESLQKTDDGNHVLRSKTQTATCVGMHASIVEQLTSRMASLHRLKTERKQMLEDMGMEIAQLWEKLHVTEEDQIAFTESVKGLGLDTIGKGKAEVARLHALKSQMLVKLVYEARDVVRSLWDAMDATDEQKLEFKPFQVSLEERFDDELLQQHEVYIQKLQYRLEQMKPILRIIEKREIIIRERYEYEELQKDPDRLQQRGAALTRQLMEEEKMARRIKRDLPRFTEMLFEKLDEWKKSHSEAFHFQGEDYLDTIERQEHEWNQYKADEVQRKLKKKQEEKSFADNRFGGSYGRHPSRKKGRGPLANAQGTTNRQVDRSFEKKAARPRPVEPRMAGANVRFT